MEVSTSDIRTPRAHFWKRLYSSFVGSLLKHIIGSAIRRRESENTNPTDVLYGTEANRVIESRRFPFSRDVGTGSYRADNKRLRRKLDF